MSGDEDFASLLAEYEAKATPRPRLETGQQVEGKVIRIGKDHVFVDLGGHLEGMLATEELRDAEGQITVAMGDSVQARVVDLEAEGGGVLLRRTVLRGPEARDELAHAFEHGIPVEGKVTGQIKGGLEVDLAGERAFCPASQIDNRFVEDLSVFEGRVMAFRITRFEGSGRRVNLVVSRRVILAEEAAEQAVETRKELTEGAIMEGTVTSTRPFGAFVDLGGLEGLIHISELSHERTEHAENVLSPGQKVRVQVLRIEKTDDPRRPEKIGLSLKSLERDPWEDMTESFRPGTRHKGTITRLMTFGAFCQLAPGLEGLIHISEMANRRIQHPKEVVKVGDEVQVEVVDIDPAQHRIGLSMNAIARAEEEAETAEARAHAPKAPASLGTFGDLLAKATNKPAKK